MMVSRFFAYISLLSKVIGRELSLALADYILKAHSDRDPKIRRFLRNIDLHILHSMNPDGFEKASMDPACKGRNGRENANFVSLILHILYVCIHVSKAEPIYL